MRLLISIGAACLVSWHAFPQSLTQQQTNALNHIAQVMAIELECPEYEARLGNLMLLTTGYRIDIADARTSSRIQGLVAEHRAGLRAAGSKVGCIIAWGLYGPGGQNVKDLIGRK